MESRDFPGPHKASPFHAVALALSFLTVIPVPSRWLGGIGPIDLARSFSCFPLIGLLLGAVASLPVASFAQRGTPLLHAALIVALLCLLTRALHLDGLADVADGFGGGYTPERRLEIMKDSRTGSFGVAAILFIVLLKIAALDSLLEHGLLGAIPLGTTLSRFAMVATAYRSPYARKEGGLGKSFVEHISTRHLGVAWILTFTLSIWLSGLMALGAIVAILILVALTRLISRRMIGGVTGDVLGAVNEASEALTWTFLAFAH